MFMSHYFAIQLAANRKLHTKVKTVSCNWKTTTQMRDVPFQIVVSDNGIMSMSDSFKAIYDPSCKIVLNLRNVRGRVNDLGERG